MSMGLSRRWGSPLTVQSMWLDTTSEPGSATPMQQTGQDDVKRLAVFDAAVPGVTPPPAAGIPSPEANLKTWHFGFNRLDDPPELLLQGPEREFFSSLFPAKPIPPSPITPADLHQYVPHN